MVYPRRLDIVPCAIYRTLLFIHSKCNSLHLPTPNSQFIPFPPPLPLGIHKSDLYICESVSILYTGSFVLDEPSEFLIQEVWDGA